MPKCKFERNGIAFEIHVSHYGSIEGGLLDDIRANFRKVFGWTPEDFALEEK